MYKAIIFDFFDVIHTDRFQAWLRSHGLKREGEVHALSIELDHGHIDLAEFFERLGRIGGQTADEVKAEFDEAAKVDHDLVALISELHKSFKIGLLSNANSAYLRDILQKHGLEDLFHDIVISSEVGIIKPDPKIFHHILDKLGVKPAEAIFTDDNLANVTASQALGLTGLLYRDLDSFKADLKKLGIAIPPLDAKP